MVLVAATRLFSNRAAEYFFFAGCMMAVTLVFAWLARRYKYRAPPGSSAAASTSRASMASQTDERE